jgi:hypothetical protein
MLADMETASEHYKVIQRAIIGKVKNSEYLHNENRATEFGAKNSTTPEPKTFQSGHERRSLAEFHSSHNLAIAFYKQDAFCCMKLLSCKGLETFWLLGGRPCVQLIQYSMTAIF